MPDEPAPKKKSLKNFFSAKEVKEKESSSINEDNLLKNILGELDSGNNTSAEPSTSVTVKPLKVIRKQATESEIEMKNYMEQFGKKIQQKKKNDVNGDVSQKVEQNYIYLFLSLTISLNIYSGNFKFATKE